MVIKTTLKYRRLKYLILYTSLRTMCLIRRETCGHLVDLPFTQKEMLKCTNKRKRMEDKKFVKTSKIEHVVDVSMIFCSFVSIED